MTTKDNMKKTIMNDFDKKKNYNCILKRIGDNKMNSMEKYKKFIVPGCLVALILICGIVVFNNNSKNLKNTDNNSSQKEEQKQNVPDNIVFNDGSIGKNNDSIAARPVYTSVKTQFKFLENLTIPDGFVISNEMEVYVNADEDDHNMSKLWEYNIEYCKFNTEKTECLNSFGISFTKEEQILGMGLWKRDESKYKKSTINGHEVTLYGNDDANGKEAFFEYDGYNFYIASTHLTKDEFINLLKSIIK